MADRACFCDVQYLSWPYEFMIVRFFCDRTGLTYGLNEFVIMIMRAEQDRHHDRERVFKVRYVDKTVNLLSKF